MTRMVNGWRKAQQAQRRADAPPNEAWQRERQRQYDIARDHVRRARQQLDKLASDIAATWFTLYSTPKTTDPDDPYATLVLSDGEWLREIVNLLDVSAIHADTWLGKTVNVPQLVASQAQARRRSEMGRAAPATRRLTNGQ